VFLILASILNPECDAVIGSFQLGQQLSPTHSNHPNKKGEMGGGGAGGIFLDKHTGFGAPSTPRMDEYIIGGSENQNANCFH